MYGYGNSLYLTANKILASSNAGTPPVNTVAPVISGTQVVGSALSTINGTWTGTAPITYTYQWYRGATLISGATASAYTLVQADAGNTSNITCQVTATNAFGSATATSNILAQIMDFDANAFLTAASITDSTQKSATNALTIDLKGYSIWTKFKAIYPIVGGSASSHAVNLKTPGTYNLTFSTGWTHSSTGMTPSNAFANTSLVPSSVLSLDSTHIASYLRTNLQFSGPIISSENASTYNNGLYIWPWQSSNQYSIRINDNGLSGVGAAPANIRGLHIATRTASNVKKYRLNNTQIFNSSESSTGLNTSSIYIGASRNNSNYNNNQQAFVSIGDGLTDTEAANFYTAVQAYQTTLSRQV